jgi:menaquinol-cytochrome c reductase iron-sulfur subunit
MSDGETGRRGALRHLIVLGSAAIGCAVAAPAAMFVAAPVKSGGGNAAARWVKTIRFDSLREGEPHKVAIVDDERDAWTISRGVELGSVWLVRHGDEVVALSAVCPHLGCAVNALADGSFACPCHTSTFAPSGEKTGGPTPRGMDPLATKIDAGFVDVDFRKFRIGTSDREAIG